MRRICVIAVIGVAAGALSLVGLWTGPGAAQETAAAVSLPIHDPDDIAALCGGDPELGAPLFAASCAACHTLEEGGADGDGPNLYALYGGPPAQSEGFAYSEALREAAATGMIWERDTIRAYLKDPTGFLPGTTKVFQPEMVDEDYRTNLMTYVRVTTTPPPPAPEDVMVPEAVLAMAGDVPYGEFLASECATCHVNGQVSATGVPQIDHLAREEMIRALFQYRIGARDNQTMATVARSLGDEEIVSLAAYFEGLK